MTTETLTTDFKVVAIDETQHWTPDMKAKCGKISTVYLFDASVVTFPCSITPHYNLKPLYYITENEVSDEVYEELQNTFNTVETEDRLFTVADIDRMETVSVENNIEFTDSESDEYREHHEEIV